MNNDKKNETFALLHSVVMENLTILLISRLLNLDEIDNMIDSTCEMVRKHKNDVEDIDEIIKEFTQFTKDNMRKLKSKGE